MQEALITKGVRVHVLRWSIALIVIAAALSAPPERIAAAAGGDSLCVSFTGPPGGLHLHLMRGYGLGGVVPFTVCTLEPGKTYRTTLDGGGFERRIGTFSIDGSGRCRSGGIRIGTLLRNTVVPGWGSVRAHRAAPGVADGLTLAGSLIVLSLEDRDYRDLKDRYSRAIDRSRHAGTQEELQRYMRDAHFLSREANVQNEYRKRLIYLSAYLYGFQLIEPWLAINPPRMRSESGGNIIDVGSARATRFKALLHSLLHPGRGQFYQGKTYRGVFFSVTSVAAGMLALEYYHRYDYDAMRYEIAVEHYSAATTIDEKRIYGNEASEIWNDVEKQKRRRNALLATTAGLWGLSLIDTMFPAGAPAGGERYALDIGPGGCALAVRF